MILDGKGVRVTGVLTPPSIAFTSADLAQRVGAEIVVACFGAGHDLTKKSGRAARNLAEWPFGEAVRPRAVQQE